MIKFIKGVTTSIKENKKSILQFISNLLMIIAICGFVVTIGVIFYILEPLLLVLYCFGVLLLIGWLLNEEG